MKVIVINGVGGSGKDQFISFIDKLVFSYNVSTIDVVKEAARILGWDGLSKEKEDRKFLSDLKKLSTQYSDINFKDVLSKFKIACSFGVDGIFFIHCREPKEIERFKQELNAKTLLVRRPGLEPLGNASDDGVEDFVYDYVIINGSTLDSLKEKAKHFARKIAREVHEN